jgi:putative ABC transport system permease protein
MRPLCSLFQKFILRALAREKLRTILTLVGISLGVGVVVAIRLANASALTSFRSATEAIAGETTLEIVGTAGRFDELWLRDLLWLQEYGQASPVITGYAMTIPEGEQEKRGEFLQVLGVDILRDRTLRRYRLLQLHEGEEEPSTREFFLLLADPRAVVVTQKFARRRGLSIGQSLALVIGDTQREFTIRGLLLDEGPARALDGNLVLMDLAAAQWAFHRLGWLDRVDLKLYKGIALERAEADIAKRLPAGLTILRPEARYGQVEKMIAAFHFNLNALASIALFVGLFLVYNTISISVITRREEIGMLRAVGVSRSLVLALFLGEALLLASLGAGIGLGLGKVMARTAVQATSTTVETFYLAVINPGVAQTLGGADIIFAFVLTLLLAFIAAIRPAWEAAQVQPVEAIRGAERLNDSTQLSWRAPALAGGLLFVGALLSCGRPIHGLPLFGYFSALALVLGGVFLVPGTLWIVCRKIGRALSRLTRLLHVESLLASASLSSAISRVSISIGALAVSLAMMTAISIMIGSFRETVVYWIDQTLRADIYARPLTRVSSIAEGDIDPRAVERVAADPEVEAIDAFAAQSVSFQDSTITLAGGDYAVLLEHGRLLFKAPQDAFARIREAIGRDAVTISESFAVRFDKKPGDIIELPTPLGLRPFEVLAVFYDYSSNRGVAVMDRSTYLRYFPAARPSSLSIYLKSGANAETVRGRLARDIGSDYQLLFNTNQALRAEAMRIFDSTFAITYALELIAIVVAGLGVIATLMTLILERRREFALLSILGATRAQIRRMLVIEAVYIGGVGQIVGVLIGVLLSLVLIYVINVQSFGWTIQFHMPVAFLLQSTMLILLAAAVAGLYPATRATNVEAVRFVREE